MPKYKKNYKEKQEKWGEGEIGEMEGYLGSTSYSDGWDFRMVE